MFLLLFEDVFSISLFITWYQESSEIVSIPYSKEKVKSRIMKRFKSPPELDIESLNLADQWKEWSEKWELYRISSGLKKMT